MSLRVWLFGGECHFFIFFPSVNSDQFHFGLSILLVEVIIFSLVGLSLFSCVLNPFLSGDQHLHQFWKTQARIKKPMKTGLLQPDKTCFLYSCYIEISEKYGQCVPVGSRAKVKWIVWRCGLVLTKFIDKNKSFNNKHRIPAYKQLCWSLDPLSQASMQRESEREWGRETALMNWKISDTDYLGLLCLIAVWESDHHQAGSRGGGRPRRRAVQSSLSENVSAD